MSNASLAARLSALVDRWDRRENQMIAVLTQADGNVTVTDGLDEDHQIPSFPSLQKLVTDLVDELTGEVAGVRDIATQVTALANAAGESAEASASSADQSAASALASAVSADASLQSSVASATSATASEESMQASDNRANASAASAVESANSANQSAGSATLATDEANDSAASASMAVLAMGDAQVARNLSQAWAANPEDVAVVDGEFSAKHWAKKAQSFATGSLVYLGAWDASTNTLPPGAAKGAFYKIVGTGTVDGVTYRSGDNIVHNGTGWDLIDNTETVTAVAGKVGNVELTVADVGGLDAALTGKANTSHSHAIGDVVNLQSTLDAKVPRAMETTFGDKISLFGDRAGRTDFHGFGVEDTATYTKSALLHRWYAGTNADGTNWCAQLSQSALTLKGVLQTYRGAVGTQQICMTMGWSNSVQRINHVIEADGSYSVWTYDANGSGPSLDMKLQRGGALSANSLIIGGAVTAGSTITAAGTINSNSGAIYTKGSGSGFWFTDRTNGILRCLYSDGDITRVWNGSGDIAKFTNSTGDFTTIGWMYAPNFKINSDLRLKKNQVLLNGREELEKLKLLLPMQYDKQGHHEFGFGAQHLKTVYPTMVSVGDGPAGADTHTLSVGELLAPVVAAVQELDRRLTEAGI